MSAKDFVHFIVSSLVEDTSAIVIEERQDDLGTLVTLRVAKPDMKTIIGREGQTISSIRTVLRVYGAKQNARVNLKIIEDETT